MSSYDSFPTPERSYDRETLQALLSRVESDLEMLPMEASLEAISSVEREASDFLSGEELDAAIAHLNDDTQDDILRAVHKQGQREKLLQIRATIIAMLEQSD